VIVTPARVTVWPAASVADVAADGLLALLAVDMPVDVLLIGCGREFVPEPAGLRAALKAAGIVLEWMDTGAACRTYNVLVGEDRRVAAALLAVA